MNFNYKVIKFRSNNSKEVNDQISIEEPLEIILRYKDKENWIENTISITMRTPGDDEDLVRGFLFNERVIEKIDYIESIELAGEPVGKYKLKNKAVVTITLFCNLYCPTGSPLATIFSIWLIFSITLSLRRKPVTKSSSSPGVLIVIDIVFFIQFSLFLYLSIISSGSSMDI